MPGIGSVQNGIRIQRTARFFTNQARYLRNSFSNPALQDEESFVGFASAGVSVISPTCGNGIEVLASSVVAL